MGIDFDASRRKFSSVADEDERQISRNSSLPQPWIVVKGMEGNVGSQGEEEQEVSIGGFACCIAFLRELQVKFQMD